MAICDHCGKEMLDSKITTCKNFTHIRINGKIYKRNDTYFDKGNTKDEQGRGRCHDCGILNNKGNFHHYGCDMEMCPVCKKQLAFCDCDKQELINKNSLVITGDLETQ